MALSATSPGSPLPTDGANRTAKFRERFPEINHESLVRYIPCNWRKSRSRALHGGLYLTDNHIGFYCASKSHGPLSDSERKALLDVESIAKVAKIRSLSIFPDSISVETSGGQKYVFSQLFSRNAVYKSICDLCGFQESSRRGSIDPHFGHEESENEHCDDSLFNESHAESNSSSSSSSPSEFRAHTNSFNKKLSRMLSVVHETSQAEDYEVESSYSRSTTRFAPILSRSTSQIKSTPTPVNSLASQTIPTETETDFGQKLIQVLTFTAVLLTITAAIAFVQLCITYIQSASQDHQSEPDSQSPVQTRDTIAHFTETAQKYIKAYQTPYPEREL